MVCIDLQFLQSPQLLLGGSIRKVGIQMLHARSKTARMDKAEAARYVKLVPLKTSPLSIVALC